MIGDVIQTRVGRKENAGIAIFVAAGNRAEQLIAVAIVTRKILDRLHVALRFEIERAVTEHRIDKRIALRLITSVTDQRDSARVAAGTIGADVGTIVPVTNTHAERHFLAEPAINTERNAAGGEVERITAARRIAGTERHIATGPEIHAAGNCGSVAGSSRCIAETCQIKRSRRQQRIRFCNQRDGTVAPLRVLLRLGSDIGDTLHARRLCARCRFIQRDFCGCIGWRIGFRRGGLLAWPRFFKGCIDRWFVTAMQELHAVLEIANLATRELIGGIGLGGDNTRNSRILGRVWAPHNRYAYGCRW